MEALSFECLSNADDFQQPGATFPAFVQSPACWCICHQILLLSVLPLLTNFCSRIALLLHLSLMHALALMHYLTLCCILRQACDPRV